LRFRRASSSLHSGNGFETLGHFACRRSFPPPGLNRGRSISPPISSRSVGLPLMGHLRRSSNVLAMSASPRLRTCRCDAADRRKGPLPDRTTRARTAPLRHAERCRLGGRPPESSPTEGHFHAFRPDNCCGLWCRKILDQGLGSVRFLGSGADACRVHEPALQLPRQDTDNLHALDGQ
jgi:hypothetical protein